MHLNFVNVNDAFMGIVRGMNMGSIETFRTPSRVGEVIQIAEPMTISYQSPRQRVLFNDTRDGNPFFHMFESMWMLAGQNDVASLAYYSSKIGSIASDDGETFNGAYGYRWRHPNYLDLSGSPSPGDIPYGGADQLDIIVDHFKRTPASRRVVLQMWTVEDDLMKIDKGKDVCCNTAAYFLIRRGDCPNCVGGLIDHERNHSEDAPSSSQCPRCKGFPKDMPLYLDMTVTNRSNDLIWGMLGANVVHFSFLQEYLACSLGLEVGTYHQFTNNLHAYTETNSKWYPEEWLGDELFGTMLHSYPEVSDESKLFWTPSDRELFDKEVKEFVRLNSTGIDDLTRVTTWETPFLKFVAQPFMHAFHMHKLRDYAAANFWINETQADDWGKAGQAWLNKREKAYQNKSGRQPGDEA